LGDAERIAAYLADLAKNKTFKTIVAALTTPRDGVVESKLNGIDINVQYMEIDPCKTVNYLDTLSYIDPFHVQLVS